MSVFKPAADADAAWGLIKLCVLIGLPKEICELLAVLETVVRVEAPLFWIV